MKLDRAVPLSNPRLHRSPRASAQNTKAHGGLGRRCIIGVPFRASPVNGKASPSMNVVLGVQVPPKGDHPKRSELQLRVGDHAWGGSRERNRGPMNKNRIGGGAERGERAR